MESYNKQYHPSVNSVASTAGKSFFQPKLTINNPNDKYEQEADAVADKVMQMETPSVQKKSGADSFFSSSPVSITPLQRKCDNCKEEEKMQRKEIDREELTADNNIENYVGGLQSGGQPLPNEARNFYEPRFGYDFSNVKIHTDNVAAKSAQSINALAYTSGSNIVFNTNQYSPNTDSGKKLLGHELTHVVQQGGSIQAKKIQRAVVRVNNQSVTIDYGNVIGIANYLTGIQAAITIYTGAAPTPAMDAAITALSPQNQRWLLFGLDVLTDNTTAAQAALNRVDAINRLIAFVPSSTTQPLGNIANTQLFAREVLISSGWTDVTLTRSLTAPGVADRAIIDPIINPPATGGLPPGPLNVAMLNSRLTPALRSLLIAIDPALITTVGTQSISNIQAIGDLILAEARVFFSPFSDASSASVFNVNPTWVASANISDTTAQVPDTAARISYLKNRAQIVGWNDTPSANIADTNIFADANFDGTRSVDDTELLNIITTMETDAVIQPIVDRLIQHTGFKTGSGISTHIGINPEFNISTTTECQARWRTVDTLCHEVLHALVHPNFQSAASRISFNQVVREGFTEVLGNQLFNDHVVIKAAANPAFKISLEAGIVGSPCPAPATGTIGYGSAGTGAETIRARVHDSNFRAAYFLGRTDLVGF